nr:PREDICTED: cell surface glycoprotein 1-like [Daucus carota subsp. sativus]
MELIFSYCFPDVPLPENGNELPFKITKRAFTDLIKKDSKKNTVPVFAIPVTVQDKLKIALPDKYEALFSDENIPQPPSPAHEPIAKSDPKPTSGSSQQGPSEDPEQPLIPFSDPSAEPLLIEPISAMPLDTAAADKQMSESSSDHNVQTEGTKSETIAADTDISEKPSDAPDIDDDEGTEVTSTPIQAPGLHSIISEPVREPTPERADSPIKALSPVRESTPFVAPTVPSSPIPFSEPARRKLCHLSYTHRMCRTTSPSVEDRLTSIEATQASMNYTLADLSASVAQLNVVDPVVPEEEVPEEQSEQVTEPPSQANVPEAQTSQVEEEMIVEDAETSSDNNAQSKGEDSLQDNSTDSEDEGRFSEKDIKANAR